MPERIAILGSAPSSRLLAPFSDKSWEIWACSVKNMGNLPRADVWFELHSLERRARESGPYLDELKKQPKIYMQAAHPDYPGAIAYPKDAMVAKYGRYWFTSSVAYMAALAIEQQPKMIGFWGVDMSTPHEYGHQRPGCQFFIERATEAGIDVVLPPESDLSAPPPLYGYRETDPMWAKLNTRRQELERRLNKSREEAAIAAQKEATFAGALEDIEYVMNTWAHHQ